jgi:hypothetical protein
MNGRSEYLRRNPAATSIRSILKFPEQIDAPPRMPTTLPMCAILSQAERRGGLSILLSNGVDFVPNMARIQTASSHGGQMNNDEQ